MTRVHLLTFLQPVRRRLPLLIGALLLAVMTAFSAITFRRFERALLTAGDDRVKSASQRLAMIMQEGARMMRVDSRRFAGDSAIHRYLRTRDVRHAAAATNALQQRLGSTSMFLGVELRDTSGKRLLAVGNPPAAASPLADVPHWNDLLPIDTTRRVAIGPLMSAGGSVYYEILAPAMDVRGRTLGYVTQYRRISASAQTARLIPEVIGSEATVLVGNVRGSLWSDMAHGGPAPVPNAVVGSVFTLPSHAGETLRAMVSRVPNAPWMVLVAIPQDHMLAPSRDLLGATAWLAALLLVAGALGTWLLSRQITRPIAKMVRAAEGIARGDYSRRVAGNGRTDELGQLATSFNRMAEQIDDARKLEAQMRQSQRLEAVGQLAGGVAHDFNNLLTVIKAHATFALEDLGVTHPQAADVQTIHDAAERAASLTRHLLAFSRRQLLEPRVLDLNELITQFERMVRRVIPVDIGIVLKLADDLAATAADPGQLEQVLMNLVVNARDAMPDGGTIVIETMNVELDANSIARHAPADVVPGGYVELVVSDCGVGMDEATQARIFEPFFTTKEKGKGTGLGLSTAYGIVKQSGGYIWVYSELGKGTTVRVYLPRVERAPGRVDAGADAPEPARGGETVLVVEDESLVRSVARRVLTNNGYCVLEAENGVEALRVCAERLPSIDLVVTDLAMPEMGGRELAAELHARRPALRILFMSGYTEDAALRRNVLEPGEAFIAKPFTPEAFARKVREVLDGQAVVSVPDGAYAARRSGAVQRS